MDKPSHKKMTSKSPMYIYATEMVSNYYRILNIKNKRVLSIVGSGDQIINAYFFGAKEVVGFDINKYTFFMLDLKISAIFNLTYSEFINFFGKDLNTGTFSFALYNKFKKDLPRDTKIFFDKLYRNFSYNGKKLIKSNHFRQRQTIKSLAVDTNIYLKNENSYIKCREIMQNKNLQFLELDLNDILTNKNLKGKFDIINLSNVLNYLTGNTEEKYILKVLIGITKKISKRIKKEGLFFSYSYSPWLYDFTGRQIPPASILKIISEIKKVNNFQVTFKRFGGINNNTLDRINIFKIYP